MKSVLIALLLTGGWHMVSSHDETAALNHWQLWTQRLGGVLLDTPQKAASFAEAVVEARYGQAEVEEERPFAATDRGDYWEVRGTNGGSHLVPLIPAFSVITLRKTTGEIVDYTFLSPWRAPG